MSVQLKDRVLFSRVSVERKADGTPKINTAVRQLKVEEIDVGCQRQRHIRETKMREESLQFNAQMVKRNINEIIEGESEEYEDHAQEVGDVGVRLTCVAKVGYV